LGQSLIPVVGAMMSARYHLDNDNYWRAAGFTALAISDVFLVKALVVAGGRVALEGLTTAATTNAGGKAGAPTATHLTSAEGAKGIAETGRIGGQWGVFALTDVPASQLGRQAATLVGAPLTHQVTVTSAAFRAPRPYGVFSGARNLAGVHSTPLGSVNVRTGAFIPGEVLVNGTFQQATRYQAGRFLIHQALLDSGVDLLLNATMATGLHRFDDI
jgi:hypothetical protein